METSQGGLPGRQQFEAWKRERFSQRVPVHCSLPQQQQVPVALPSERLSRSHGQPHRLGSNKGLPAAPVKKRDAEAIASQPGMLDPEELEEIAEEISSQCQPSWRLLRPLASKLRYATSREEMQFIGALEAVQRQRSIENRMPGEAVRRARARSAHYKCKDQPKQAPPCMSASIDHAKRQQARRLTPKERPWRATRN